MQPTKYRGFTLVELMIAVAIIGVLASFAIPQYRNYVTKAKLTEAFLAVTPVKYRLVEYVAVNGSTAGLAGKGWSAVLKELGVSTNFFGDNSRYVKNVWWNNTKGEIRVSFTDNLPEANGRYLVMRADMDSGAFRWRCLSSSTYSLALPAEYLPSSCQ
ncbi:MAG: pilin [Gammaproteobacteria bacterium]|nr:pilin [Gammaproteobacteria bacterium]